MNELYPLKFRPIYRDKIWGGSKIKTILGKDFSPLPNCGESWELSGVPGYQSVVANGFLEGDTLHDVIETYMDDLVGDKVFQKFGLEFPLLIKFIDANDALSIQVHPDDNLAYERHNSFGKTEMWYVMHADKDAELISGFNKQMDKETYLKHLNSNKIKDILNVEKVQKGDTFYIPAGRVHAIGKGILLAEIQQTSDVTYRIYDWERLDDYGQPRKLHTEQAIDAIDYTYHKSYKTEYKIKENNSSPMVDSPYFFTSYLTFNKTILRDYNWLDSFIIYICVEGNFSIEYKTGETVQVNTGETVLIPAMYSNLKLITNKDVVVLEVFIK